MDAREGRLVVDDAGHEIHYLVYGEGEETLIGLHGGPGGTHRYLVRLGELAGDGLQVVLYDQLGSGLSDRPDDDSLWTTPYFVGELETVRQKLGLGRMHVFGQSWGGILALQYALDHPDAVASLVLSNTAASIPECVQGMGRLRTELPPDLYSTLLRHEATGEYEHPDYKAAVKQLYIRHLRRSTPFDPERALREFAEIVEPITGDMGRPYYVMWGPNEFAATGNLLDWDVTDRLGEIRVPALILCGWYDEVTVSCHRTLADGIPDNEFLIFGNSSQITILEKEADLYLDAIRGFLRRARSR